MAISTKMSCAELDKALKAFLDILTEENNGKVVYIRNGALAAEDGNALFDVVPTQQ